MMEWAYLVETTAEQREKLFQESCKYLPHQGGGYLGDDDKFNGLELAMLCRDKRVVPLVRSLLQDPSSDVRQFAQESLDYLASDP